MTDQVDFERYTLPPRSATTSQETGMSKWETTMAREEIENWEGIFGQPFHKPSFAGGGESSFDLVFENPDMVSPEAQLLLVEFLRQSSAGELEDDELKPKFSAWLSDRVKDELNTEVPDHYPPTEIVLDPDKVSFDLESFKNLWRSPNTRVVYQYNKDGRGGHLIFRGKSDGGRTKTVEIYTGELTKNAFGRPASLGIPMTEGERQIFWANLQSFRIDDKPLAADKMDFIYPVDLSLREDAVLRKFSPDLQVKVFKFNELWRNGKAIRSIGFGFKKGAIGSIALETTGRQRRIIQLPFDVFRGAYGVLRFEGKDNGRFAEGGDFGGLATLTPATPTDKFIDILASITIHGVPLPSGTRVVVADFSSKGKPTATTLGYT